MKTRPLISKELAGFLESGLSHTVASRDGELRTDAARACAVRISPDRTRLTLYIHRPNAAAVLRNLKIHGEIAVCVDRPSDSHSCQLKGRFVASRPARADERAEVQRQAEGFRAELEAIGIPRIMTAGWPQWPCVAVAMEVTAIFEQTPGPGAGDPLPAETLPGGPLAPEAAP